MQDSLDGLSVGDALGEQFFGWRHTADDLREGWLPDAPWRWTDDTCLASTLAAHVLARGGVAQDRLAAEFARDFEMGRGFGPSARDLLFAIDRGADWRVEARIPFGGTGSCGNGSAMRVAPLGAYHHDDLATAARQAALSAEVTHPHPEGVAGAVAVACVAAHLASARLAGAAPRADDVLAAALEHTPDSEVGTRLRQAAQLLGAEVQAAVALLGTGYDITCQDTVPFCVWAAATYASDYPAAIAACVEGRGDVDTTSAIVGGMVAAFTGIGDRDGARGVPKAWLGAREPLPHRP